MALTALVFAGVTVRDGADDINKLTLDTTQKGANTIAPEIYGQFAEHLGRCVYEGFWVGEDSDIPNTGGIRNDVVEALKKMKVPVLRWPGGCFADEYHWQDGIGPRDERRAMVNTHWGMVTDDNSFGTHEFMALCEMLHGKDIPPIVAINEAVDIAKKYSTVESGGFVNGILDKIRKDLLSDEGSAGRKKEGE